MTGGKKQLGWAVNEEISEAFKRFVLAKCGKLHTSLGEELGKAMKAYIQDHQSLASTHTNTQIAPHARGLKRANEIFNLVVLDAHRAEGKLFVPGKVLDDAIRKVSGADDRTLRKYRKLLLDLGWLGLHSWGVHQNIYRVAREPGSSEGNEE